jgi:hypothetical protein
MNNELNELSELFMKQQKKQKTRKGLSRMRELENFSFATTRFVVRPTDRREVITRITRIKDMNITTERTEYTDKGIITDG